MGALSGDDGHDADRRARRGWRLRRPKEPFIDDDGECPKCQHGSLRLESDRPDGVFGNLGVRVQVWRCDTSDCDYVLVRREASGLDED